MVEALDGLKLLDELKGGGFEAALCTTYNVSFPFFEEVLLRRLRQAGCRHVVLLADAARVAEELEAPARRPSYAGQLYTLAPIAVPDANACFHPKLLLLLGAKKARLYVGSHNITYAGLIQNVEVTTRFDAAGRDDRDGSRLIGDALAWLARVGADQPPAIRDAIAALSAFADWQGALAPVAPTRFLGSERSGPSLLERVIELAPRKPKRVTLVAPFFDGDLTFLAALRRRLGCPITVGLDVDRITLDTHRARALDGVTFVDGSRALGKSTALHAKAMLIEDHASDTGLLVAGSANASAVAWLANDGSGNVEAVSLRSDQVERLDAELGLRAVATAPPLTPAEWERLERNARERRATEQENGSPGSATTALCFEERDGLFVAKAERLAGLPTRIDAVSGTSLIPTTWTVEGPNIVVQPPAGPFQLLRVEHERGVAWAVCHHTARIADLAEPSARRRLREALGSLEGIDHLEEALHAAEKVIFDDETVFRPRQVKIAGDHSATEDAAAQSATGSFAIPMAQDDRAEARRKRIARDELALLLDAVLRALYRELPQTDVTAATDQELASDDAKPKPDPEDEQDAAKLERLGQIVRRKSKTLIMRVTKIVTAAQKDPDADPARAVVRAVAVLGLLFALRRAEERPTWRDKSIELIDRDAFGELSSVIVPAVFAKDGLLARARAEDDGDAEELIDAPNLFVWWAWTAEVDGPPDAGAEGAEDAATRLAHAIVACQAMTDKEAQAKRFLERARATPRRGVSPAAWWEALERDAEVARGAATLPRSMAPCAPGSLLRAGPQHRPSVAICVRGSIVDVADLSDGGVLRKFKTGQVEPVAWQEAAPRRREA